MLQRERRIEAKRLGQITERHVFVEEGYVRSPWLGEDAHPSCMTAS